MAEERKTKIISPFPGSQELFVRSSADIAIFGGNLGGGKTAGAILANAEPGLDSNYRAMMLRRTYGELKSAGGPLDEFAKLYGNNVTVTKSENPRITFKQSGAWIELRQIADENPAKVRETFKGTQVDCVFFEELTGFQFYTFNYIASRVRGQAEWTGKVRATTNPSKYHFVRKMLDWYIGEDGLVIPERSGIVRYVYLDGEKVEDYVWGDSKSEVYAKCKTSIDRRLASMKRDDITYENFIKSFVFYLGNLSENKAIIENNPDYVGNVSGAEGEALLLGNWNWEPSIEDNLPIQMSEARRLTENEPQVNGRKYIVVDLADTGTNATVIEVFDGFHLMDAQILNVSTPKENCDWIRRMARKHDIADSHIIYDAQRAAYMLDSFPNAVPYYSYQQARGVYKRAYKRRKDENYARLIEAINSRRFSIAPHVADMMFQRTKYGITTFMQKFISECGVVQWTEDTMSGKQRLLEKKEMNSKLGRGESMDCLDSAHMLMSVYEGVEFGMELEHKSDYWEDERYNNELVNIYDDSTWA